VSDFPRNPVEITAISCPDSCNIAAAEKGCHFQMGPDAFTCTKCPLKIRRSFSGYLLSCADLNEMLHGLKITADAKILQRKGEEYKSHLKLDANYHVRLASKAGAVARKETQEVCPSCGSRIFLFTKGDGSKYCGCAGLPKCTYTKKFVPHAFNRDPVIQKASPPAPTGQGNPVHETVKPTPALPAVETNPEPRPAETVALERNAEIGPFLDPFGNPDAGLQPRGDMIFTDALSLPPDIPEPLLENTSDKYWRIPKFIKELLRLQDEEMEIALTGAGFGATPAGQTVIKPDIPDAPPIPAAPPESEPRPHLSGIS